MLLEIFGSAKDGSTDSVVIELSLKDALSFRQRFPFDVYAVQRRPNYLTAWVTVITTTLQLSTTYFAIDRLPRVTGSNTEYCKVDFQLSGAQYLEDHIVATSMDTMGEIAAFFGAISGVVALLMTAYNEESFYKKFPAWGEVREDFAPVPVSVGPTVVAPPESREPIAAASQLPSSQLQLPTQRRTSSAPAPTTTSVSQRRAKAPPAQKVPSTKSPSSPSAASPLTPAVTGELQPTKSTVVVPPTAVEVEGGKPAPTVATKATVEL